MTGKKAIPLPLPPKRKAKAGDGRPKKGYWATVGDGVWQNIREWYPKKADGKQTRVPSVTTILSRFKDGGGLTHWAWELGMNGQDYRDVRDEAAGAGTLAHDNVERYLLGQELVWEHQGIDPEVIKRAKRAFEAFLRWADQSQLEVTHTEVPLVSNKYLYGGTLDDILVKGERAIGDWKTSNRLYADYFVQVAGGYKLLWEEHHPEQPIEGGIHIIRFDKTYGDFEHRHFQNDIEIAARSFLLQRELYEIDKELKRRIG